MSIEKTALRIIVKSKVKFYCECKIVPVRKHHSVKTYGEVEVEFNGGSLVLGEGNSNILL
jgi:hypothetical protein